MSCHSNKCCDPCPPCETQFPETCEAFASTNEATSFVVEDSAFCKKTITGDNGQVPQIVNGLISFTDATSAASPNTIVGRDSLGGSEFARIDATELHVNNPTGDTKIEIGGIGNVYVDLKNPDTDDYDLRLQASVSDQRIYTNGSKLLIDASVVGIQSITNQDVGIGTDAPLHKLDVFESQTGQTAIRAYNPDTAGASSAGLLAQQGGVSANFIAKGNAELNLGTVSAHPVVIKTNNSDRAYITSAGNVGINISNPLAQLHVQNSSATDTVRITQLGAGAALRVEDDALETTPFIVDGSGNVGVGTSTPFTTLHTISGIAGGNPQTTGSTDANVFARLQGGFVATDFGALAAGTIWIQPRLPSNFSTNYGLLFCPNGGNIGIGTLSPNHRLEVNGGIRSTTNTEGIGYATGAGGAVTQGSGSGKSTGVTLDRICGAITMDGAALGAGASVQFTLTNSTIGVFDTVVLAISGGTAGAYTVVPSTIAAGSIIIRVTNTTGGSLSESPVVNFAVIKAVNA